MNETIRLLADRIRQIESARPSTSPAIPLGCGLGRLFPAHELPAGSLIELVASADGAGAWTLALLLAKYACGDRKMLLVADHQRSFYPPAAVKLGIALRHMVIIRSPQPRDTLLAASQALRCPAVGAVIGQFERLTEREVRRLQLAAETGGGIGVLVRPITVKSTPSFATVRLLLSPCPPGEERVRRRQVSVEVLRCRGDREGRTVLLEIDDETGDVRAFSDLAAAARPSGPARPAG